MLEVWTDLLTLFIRFISYFTNALYDVLNNLLNFDIKAFEINLSLFSDTPIFTISLYHLLNIIIFIVVFLWFFNTIMLIIFAPLRYVKRYLSPRGVIRK